MTPALATIARDPALLDDLTPAQLVGLIAAAGALLAQKGAAPDEADRLITPEEAAAIVGLSAAYIRKHKSLTFVVQPTGANGRIKCSLARCRQYVVAQRRRAG